MYCFPSFPKTGLMISFCTVVSPFWWGCVSCVMVCFWCTGVVPGVFFLLVFIDLLFSRVGVGCRCSLLGPRSCVFLLCMFEVFLAGALATSSVMCIPSSFILLCFG